MSILFTRTHSHTYMWIELSKGQSMLSFGPTSIHCIAKDICLANTNLLKNDSDSNESALGL